jgi:Bifunctional DNA primase/polymerase, N-terminal
MSEDPAVPEDEQGELGSVVPELLTTGERAFAAGPDDAAALAQLSEADLRRVTSEYARLLAEKTQARAREQALRASCPARSDEQAWAAHRVLAEEASQAVIGTAEAADAFLWANPAAVPVYGAARRWLALGVCTVPVRDDGSKAPIGKWKQYQECLPDKQDLFWWHRSGKSGLGIVTGRTSRADESVIEMLEFEGRAIREGVHKEFLGYIDEAGLTGVWQRILAGYWEVSPGGGVHFYFLAADCGGNVKLAKRLATAEELAENPDDRYRVLIETRGRGGFTVAAPTPGSFHDSGRPWTGNGSPEKLPLITAEEHEGIFACARKCSKVPAGTIYERPERAQHETVAGPARTPDGIPLRTRPGDVYNQRGPSWDKILEPHGWRQDGADDDGTVHWTRPGKASGTSATTSNPQLEGDKFYCFTSSTVFEPGTSYSRFAVYVILEHGGDWSAAAARLAEQGYVSDEVVCVVPPTAAEGTWAPPRDIEGAPGGSRARIELTNGEEIVLKLRWAVETGRLSDKVFLSSGSLVGVELHTRDEVAAAEAQGLAMSRVELAPVTPDLFQWYSAVGHLCYKLQKDEEGLGRDPLEIPALPQASHVRVATASPSWRHVPVITGVTAVPLLKPDGTLLASRGYDPQTGLICWPAFDIGEITVNHETVTAACRFLEDQLLRDFPFVAVSDRTNYLSLLFTPILRHYVRQLLSPLFPITATAQGSGKTYLVDIPKTLYGATVRPWVGDDEELRKAITSTLRETNPIIVFDDVDRWDSVASSTFCKALTQYEWDDRLLGLNKEFRGKNDRAWVITGNNITLGGDVPDRADGLVRLDPKMPEPKNRPVSGFALGDLREWLKDPVNCSLVLRHLLVLVLDWSLAGAPEKEYPSRFPKWAAIMGGLLGHHGFEDFLGNAASIREHHSEATWSLQGLLARWHATYGTVPQRLRLVCTDRAWEWEDVWPMTAPRKNSEPRPYSEGTMRRLFRAENGTFHGPYCVRIEHDPHQHVDLYSVQCSDPEIEPGDPAKAAIPLHPGPPDPAGAALRTHKALSGELARRRSGAGRQDQ